MERGKLHIENTILSLVLIKKLIERKKFIQAIPARFLTEQEYKEYKRLEDLEKRFLN